MEFFRNFNWEIWPFRVLLIIRFKGNPGDF